MLTTLACSLTPAYAVYENGAPTRVVLFNYASDTNATGALAYTANLQVNASTVYVR